MEEKNGGVAALGPRLPNLPVCIMAARQARASLDCLPTGYHDLLGHARHARANNVSRSLLCTSLRASEYHCLSLSCASRKSGI